MAQSATTSQSGYEFEDAEVQQAFDLVESTLKSRHSTSSQINLRLNDLFSLGDDQVTTAFKNAFYNSPPEANRWRLLYILSRAPSPSSCSWYSSFLLDGLLGESLYQDTLAEDEHLTAHDPRKGGVKIIMQFITNLLTCEAEDLGESRSSYLQLVASSDSRILRHYAIQVARRRGSSELQAFLPDFVRPEDAYLLGVAFGPDTISIGNTTMANTTPNNLPVPPLGP